MKKQRRFGILLLGIVGFACATIGANKIAAPGKADIAPFKKVMLVIFENIDYQDALHQPFFSSFASRGALFSNFLAETHPSQGNYIALTSGSLQGVSSDSNYNLDVRHIGDLLEAKGLSWKVYAEQYPGKCYQGARSGTYVRKHVPFISYKNVQKDPARCARIVEAAELQKDIQAGTLPEFSLYIPDLNNDGHDTGVAFADKWFSKVFGPLSQDSHFMKEMLLIATFDEGDKTPNNQIYTAFFGDSVKAGAVVATRVDHYSVLRTIEDTFGLGTLGLNDAKAAPITGIWK